MGSKINHSVLVLGFFFLAFLLFALFNPIITGNATLDFQNVPTSFSQGDVINGQLEIESEGEFIKSNSTFRLGLYSGSNKINESIKTAEQIFGITNPQVEKITLDGVEGFSTTNGETYSFNANLFGLKASNGTYTLKFGLYDNQELLAFKQMPVLLRSGTQAGQSEILDMAIAEVELGSNGSIVSCSRDSDCSNGRSCSSDDNLCLSNELKVGDTIVCGVFYSGPGNLTIKIFAPGDRTSNPTEQVSGSELNCNTVDGFTTCYALYNVRTFKAGQWNCYAELVNGVFIDSAVPLETLFMSSSSPSLKQNINNFNITIDGSYSPLLNLNNYFENVGNNSLEFSVVGNKYIIFTVSNGGLVRFANPNGFEGIENLTFVARNDDGITRSNPVLVRVGIGSNIPASTSTQTQNDCNPRWECRWSSCIGDFQSYSCVDVNNCGVLTGKPEEKTESCGSHVESSFDDSTGEIYSSSGLSLITKIIIFGITLLVVIGLLLGIFLFSKKNKSSIAKSPIITELKNQESLSDIIESRLNKGEKLDKIQYDLLLKNKKQADIEYSSNFVTLKLFVKQKISEGFPKDKIIDSLKMKGWKDEIIKDVMSKF